MDQVFKVPGNFEERVVFLDVETRKVPTPDGYCMPNGERLARRWSVIAGAVARNGRIYMTGHDDETRVLAQLGKATWGAYEIRYGATRDFDEMILKGRFTNARRAHLPETTWPAMPGADRANWVNIGPQSAGYFRAKSDIPSKEVPDYWNRWDRQPVFEHLLRDVAELILRSGGPDMECKLWCEEIVMEDELAKEVCGVR